MNINSIINRFKRVLRNPNFIVQKLRYKWLLFYLHNYRYPRLVKNTAKKEKIKVAFFILFDSVWKLDRLYQLLDKHSRFEPIVVVCPIVNLGRDGMLQQLNACYDMMSKRGYNVVKAYNETNGEYLDIKQSINPDIVFYTLPYKGQIDDRYYIDKFFDCLTCFVPYAFNNQSNLDFAINQPLQNLVWRYFAETDEHKSYALKSNACKGKNVTVTGYPGIDAFIDPNYNAKPTNWKDTSLKYKRVIWAPHHTITQGVINYSCFLDYAEYMIDIAKKYANCIQFVFKPHPLLRAKLDELWGKEKTNEYYQLWEEMPNTNLQDGAYENLFLTSDAMIHDSGSFIAEYLFVNKPVMRTINNEDYIKELNPIARKCLDVYYKAYKHSDIDVFLDNLLEGKDDLKDACTTFLNSTLLKNKNIPSDNILRSLLKNLSNK